MAVQKTQEEEIEFFVPEEGFELNHYLNKKLPATATGKQVRLRKQAIHHIARYRWAALVLGKMKPGRLLDVACGSGYGTRILADALPDFTIVGGDYDPRAVKHATATYGGPRNLKYSPADVVTWTSPETEEPIGEFDYIVSFDTVEHLLYRELAFVNFAEWLNKDGAFIFSTPAKKENLLNPGWEHHKIEYSFRSLHNLLRRFFESVAVPDNGTLPELGFWTDVVNKENQEYLLRGNPVVCTQPIKIGMGWPPAS